VSIALSQKSAVFGPKDTTAVAGAFEDCLRILRLKSTNDPAVLSLARKIMELAKEGERNQARLREATLKWVGRSST